jgi:hypothetical protein
MLFTKAFYSILFLIVFRLLSRKSVWSCALLRIFRFNLSLSFSELKIDRAIFPLPIATFSAIHHTPVALFQTYTSSTNFNSFLDIRNPHTDPSYFTHTDFPLISDSSLWQVVEIISYTKLNYTLYELSHDFLSTSFLFVRSRTLLAPVTCGYASNESVASFNSALLRFQAWCILKLEL